MSRTNRNFLITALAGFVVAFALAPGFGLAQAKVPARVGNIWGGFNHEPVPAEILPRERAAGLDSPAWQREQDDEVQRLYRDLMRSEGQRALTRPHSFME